MFVTHLDHKLTNNNVTNGTRCASKQKDMDMSSLDSKDRIIQRTICHLNS